MTALTDRAGPSGARRALVVATARSWPDSAATRSITSSVISRRARPGAVRVVAGQHRLPEPDGDTLRTRGHLAPIGCTASVPTSPTGSTRRRRPAPASRPRSGRGRAGRRESGCPPGRCRTRRRAPAPHGPGRGTPGHPLLLAADRHGLERREEPSRPGQRGAGPPSTPPWRGTRPSGHRQRDDDAVDERQVVARDDQPADGRDVLPTLDRRPPQHAEQREANSRDTR